jgi:hypothetical protein
VIRLIWLIALISTAPVGQTAESPEELSEFLHQDWYSIEFFVFERPNVMDFNTVESLTLNSPRALPINLRVQRPGPEGYRVQIDPITRLCLTFPTLSYKLLPEGELPGLSAANPLTVDAADVTEPEQLSEVAEADSAGGSVAFPAPPINPSLAPDPLLDLMREMAIFESSLLQTSNLWMPDDTLLMRREARRIEQRNAGRLLFHGRWIQAVPPRTDAEPILIQAGRKLAFADDVHELVGTVAITLGRYLHFEANLFFHAPGLGMEPVAIALAENGEPLLNEKQLNTAGYQQLNESRRMRSVEIHYLDHPKLGLLVRVDPIVIPEELVEAFNSLEEDDE